MEDNRKQLMKHFATVLRNLALGKETESLMSKNLVFYFTRKELIEMVKKSFDGSIPKEHNLVELENKELLELIGNDLFIISYVTEKWSRGGESLQINSKKDAPQKPASNSNKPEKQKPNDKKNQKTA